MSGTPEQLARGFLAISGDDRLSFLQGLLSNDVRSTTPFYSTLLTPQGKFMFDFFVWPQADHLLLETAPEDLASLTARLSLYRLRAKVTLTDASAHWQVFAAQHFTAPLPNGTIIPDPRTPLLGERALCAKDSVAPIIGGGKSHYTERRHQLGIAEGRTEIAPERAIPLEYNLDALNAISWDKGCYIGQELTARTRYRGLIRKRLLPIMADTPLLPGSVIMTGVNEAGEVRVETATGGLALIRLEYLGQRFTCQNANVSIAWPEWLPAHESSST